MTKSIQPLSNPKQRQKILPNFIIIGGMKCGTTSLHYYLNCHPDISMSTEKELDFFLEKKNWYKGLGWYQSQFRGKGKIYGEASPNYTNFPHWPETASLMSKILPDVKLIYLVREPIQRLISHYVHKLADGGENRSIEEALSDFEDNSHNPYICRSRYYLQLEQYLQYFDAANLLIITTEELYYYPEQVLPKIFRFLGVSDNITSINCRKRLHESVLKRRKTFLGNHIAQLPIMTKINHLPPSLRNHVNKLIYFPFSTPVSKPILDTELRHQLIEYLKDDVEQLRQFTGQKFSEWSI
ncbi:MAG: sulfotransferase domain-containing protein [Microcystis aeruginosa W13-11]|jgi:hypothetical protein|nr:sulfotransferase domain-containing protein [Microcystis aeruginosa W13-11]